MNSPIGCLRMMNGDEMDGKKAVETFLNSSISKLCLWGKDEAYLLDCSWLKMMLENKKSMWVWEENFESIRAEFFLVSSVGCGVETGVDCSWFGAGKLVGKSRRQQIFGHLHGRSVLALGRVLRVGVKAWLWSIRFFWMERERSDFFCMLWMEGKVMGPSFDGVYFTWGVKKPHASSRPFILLKHIPTFNSVNFIKKFLTNYKYVYIRYVYM